MQLNSPDGLALRSRKESNGLSDILAETRRAANTHKDTLLPDIHALCLLGEKSGNGVDEVSHEGENGGTPGEEGHSAGECSRGGVVSFVVLGQRAGVEDPDRERQGEDGRLGQEGREEL